MRIHSIVIASFAVILTATAGNAQRPRPTPATEAGIHEQCLKANNKRGCTCALETGGTMTRGRWQYFNARTYGDCMMRKGWL